MSPNPEAMIRTAIAPTPVPAATSPVAPAPRAALRWALARVEGRRLIAHPLFVLGMAVSILFTVVGGSDGGGGLMALSGGIFLFVGAGLWTFVVACLATSRERRDGAEDFYLGQPMAPRLRIEAALLSTAWPALAGTALIAVAAITIAGPDLTLDSGDHHRPLRPLELAQGPVYLMFVGCLGVFVGSWTKRAYPALLGAVILFMPPVAWLPWFVYGDDVSRDVWDRDWLAGAAVGWHVVGIAGLAALAAAGAMARHDRRPRVALIALAALAAAVAGISLGWPAGM